MASYWAQQAAKVRADEDYQPDNSWERSLRRRLEEIKPELVQELKATGDLENYIVAQVASARDLEDRLLDAGTDPFQAREAAQQQLSDLLRTKEDEEDEYPKSWEDCLHNLLEDKRPQLYQKLSASGQLQDYLHELAEGPRRLEQQLWGMEPAWVRRMVLEHLPDFLPREEQE